MNPTQDDRDKPKGQGPDVPERGDREDKAAARDADGANAEDSAGPHARPGLTNPDATPGAGALPTDTDDDEVDPGAG